MPARHRVRRAAAARIRAAPAQRAADLDHFGNVPRFAAAESSCAPRPHGRSPVVPLARVRGVEYVERRRVPQLRRGSTKGETMSGDNGSGEEPQGGLSRAQLIRRAGVLGAAAALPATTAPAVGRRSVDGGHPACRGGRNERAQGADGRRSGDARGVTRAAPAQRRCRARGEGGERPPLHRLVAGRRFIGVPSAVLGGAGGGRGVLHSDLRGARSRRSCLPSRMP